GTPRSRRVYATCPPRAVGADPPVLAGPPRAAPLAGELLTDHLPLPHATSPQSKRGDQEKRQEDRKLEQGAAQEGIQKIDVGRIRYGWCFTRGGGCERCKQRQCVVDHVCRNGQNDPDDGREDADPPTMRLHRDPKKRADDARGHCVSSEPKERVSAAELQAIWRHSRLR